LKKQKIDIQRWQDAIEYLESFINAPHRTEAAKEMKLAARLASAKEQLERVQSPEYIKELTGTIGADPMMPVTYKPDDAACQAAAV